MKAPFKTSWFVLVLISLGLVLFLYFNFWSSKKTPLAKGDKVYGGVFSFALPEPLSSVFPLETNSLSDLRVISQVFDPLAKQCDSKGTIRNYLADQIEIKNQGKTVFIRIKKGVLFHDDECFTGASRELTAEDVAFTLSFACSKSSLNQSSALLLGKIEGSDTFYKNGKNPLHHTVSGIKILGAHSLEIKLTKPYNHIIQLLSHPSLGILSKKASVFYGRRIANHPVGTGPFYLHSSNNHEVILMRNSDYWARDEHGNQLPFLEEIHINTNTNLSDVFTLFSQQKIDLLFDLPANQLELAFGTLSEAKKGKNLLHRVHIQKASKINYVDWNVSRPPFNNLLVRQAFELAIDKNRICNEVLRGDGQAINHGFIPTSSFYSNPHIPKVEVNIPAAKTLFKKAGYSHPEDFPKTLFYVNAQAGSNADLWCRDFCKQLRNNLGIKIYVVNVSTRERDQKIKSGTAAIWRGGWVGDYPDAESYLRLFYHGPKDNEVKFQNRTFDQLYLQSTLTTSETEKKTLQRLCESIVSKDCAIIPVYSEDFFVMINLRVRGFEMNSSGIIDFATIYMKELKYRD